MNKADLIIYNACVHTMVENDTHQEAVAVVGNRIVATGPNDAILCLQGSSTKRIDAGGCSLIPGINDSHSHMWEAGMLLKGILTFPLNSIKELRDAIRDRLKDMEPNEWLQGGGWIESQFQENRMPTKYDLDPVSPQNPVVLERIFSTCVANSAALRAANITRHTPDPAGGEIGRDANGEPNGLLFRAAKQLVRDVMPGAFSETKPDAMEQLQQAILRGQEEYLQNGITSIIEPGVTPRIMRAYQKLRDAGLLKLRVQLMPCWHGFAINEDGAISDQLIDLFGIYSGFGDSRLRIGGLKMAIDGGLTSKTSLRSWNYAGETSIKPFPLRLDLRKLDDWVKQAHDNGWGVGIHAMGDIAIQKGVEAIYAAWTANKADRRHQLIHCYYPNTDSLKMMADAGITLVAQPAFTYFEADGYATLLQEEQQRSFLPLRSCLDAGVPVAISTDMPSAPLNPFWGLYAAVTRTGKRGYFLGDEECIGVEEALRAMTAGGAYLSFEEKEKGAIAPGMLADMVLLDRNLVKTSQTELKDTHAALTIIDGIIA